MRRTIFILSNAVIIAIVSYVHTPDTLWAREHLSANWQRGNSVQRTYIKKLDWVDPYGRQPTDYSKWSEEHVDHIEPTKIGNALSRSTEGRQNVVDLVVNSGIYPEIVAELDTFTQDLVNAGYSVQLDTISGMSHTELRAHLASIPDLVGAIFVGELPVAWFEYLVENFPHDLYFSDLDGTYIDANSNGIYDDHTGSVEPEIWVGRIYTRNLPWDSEIRLLKNYFNKNHQYRTVGSSLPQRALSFIDDDWNYYTTCCLDSIYSDVVVIRDVQSTVASNYRSELAEGYEWIHIAAHSSPWGHTFKYGINQYRGTVFNYEIFALEPQALFYNLFACSGTRFVEENIAAGWYLFADPYGLLIVGSTKSGSMYHFEDFYGPIGNQNMCIGEAFKHWFTIWGETDWEWFYGMNILGDPTLKPLGQTISTLEKKVTWPVYRMTDWSVPEIVASDPESDGFPRISTNIDGNVWVTWESGRSYVNGRSEIYSAYRDATGWSSAMNIGPYLYWDCDADITTDNLNRPIAVWAIDDESCGQYNFEIYYSIYDGSWSSKDRVHIAAPRNDMKPKMAKDASGNVWIVWESAQDLDLNIYASIFDGTSWSSAQQVTTNSTDETTPVVVVDSLGQPWTFYCLRHDDRAEIWGSYYTGSQWLISGPISDVQKFAYHPAAAVDEEGNIWVAWQSLDSGNPDIYASWFNGSTWSPPHQITTSSEGDLFPSLTTHTSGVICLVYQSKSNGDWNIYYSYCVDSTWTTPEIVADLAGADINPHITCDNSGKLWTCWQSYVNDNWEILVSYRASYGIVEQRVTIGELNLTVSPTIFSDKVNIVTSKAHQEIKIFDVKGSLIGRLSSNENKRAHWFPKNLPAGTYFVVVKDKNRVVARKVSLLR